MNEHSNSRNLNKYHPILSVKPSYNSLVRGCPGIPATLPRVEFELQIMAPNTGSQDFVFNMDHLDVSFKTTEQLLATGMNGKDDTQTGQKNIKTEIFKKKFNLNNQSIGPVLGLKVPITIGIPETCKQTNYNEHFGRVFSTIEVVCHYRTNGSNDNMIRHKIKNLTNLAKKKDDEKFVDSQCVLEFPVLIEKFDVYPTLRKYPVLSFKEVSPDNKMNVDFKINTTCFGKDDFISVDLKMSRIEKTNSYSAYNNNGDLIYENGVPSTQGPSIFIGSKKNKKLKIKDVVMEIKEVLEVLDTQDGTFKTKENILATSTNEVNAMVTGNDIETRMNMRLMLMDKHFKKFEDAIMAPELLFSEVNDGNQNLNDTVYSDDDEYGTTDLPNMNYDNTMNGRHRKYGNIKQTKRNNQLHRNIPEMKLVRPVLSIDGTHHQDNLGTHGSLSTRGGCYFNITHFLTLKFKCSGGVKSFDITQPIIISYWNPTQVKYIEKHILEELSIAKNAKEFYDNFGGIKKIYSKKDIDGGAGSSYYLDYPSLPPMIIPYDLNFLSSNFGIEHEMKNGELKQVPMIF